MAHKKRVFGNRVHPLGKKSISSTAGALDIDLGYEQNLELILTEDVTMTVSNLQVGAEIEILVKQDATGGWSITFPAEIYWGDLLEPVFQGDADQKEFLLVLKVETETEIFGSYRYLY